MAQRGDTIPTASAGGYAGPRDTHEYKIPQVIAASAVGTMIEWYDFYIFGSLASVISPLFYPPGNDTFAYIAYLATFAVGFVVRAPSRRALNHVELPRDTIRVFEGDIPLAQRLV